jgi:hypothetical protein
MLPNHGSDAAPVFVHKRSILGNTVVIPNETAQDHGLSWAARGLLLYMLSMPTDWRLNERHLIGQSPKGRDHLRQIVRELEAHGYVRRTSIRGRDGTVSHAVWEVWDTRQEPEQMPPEPRTAYPATENPSMEQTQSQPAVYPRTGNPATDYPATENPSYYKENNLQSELRTNKSKPPLPPANDPEPVTLPAVPPASKPKGQRTATTKPRDPFASKVLPAGVVPADLSACAQLLAEWWSVKGRGRTEAAFTRACAFLRSLEPSDRIRSLEGAVIGGYQGLHPPRPQPHRRPDPNPGPPMPVKGFCVNPNAVDPNTGLTLGELQRQREAAGV